MKILNISALDLTNDERALGIEDLGETDRKELLEILNFVTPPNPLELHNRSIKLCGFVRKFHVECVMWDGPAYFAPYVERIMAIAGIKLCYPFDSISLVFPPGVKL